MGAQIAAHLANGGIEVLLLDIPCEQAEGQMARNRIADEGVARLKSLRPSPLFSITSLSLITTGNFQDNLREVGEADWIIEAVVEKLEVKRELYEKVELFRKPSAIVSSNTSGLRLSLLSEGRSAGFKNSFLGTHFFNPPRYLKLVEVIPTEETLPTVTQSMVEFLDRRLGKGVVIAKDSPNFIANRIATFSSLNSMRLMVEGGYSIEEIDSLTGTIIGRPRSATFRTADLVGLDTALLVADNLYEAVPEDEKREVLQAPPFFREMVARGWLGNKAGKGFYYKQKGEGGEAAPFVLDWEKMEYRPLQKVRFPSLDAAKSVEDTAERIRTLIYGSDRVGEYLWKSISQGLIYAANRIPEVSDEIFTIDRAVRWGFGYEFGIFDLWDAIGVERSVAKLTAEGAEVPGVVDRLLSRGNKSFYERQEGRVTYFDIDSGQYEEVPEAEGILILKSLKERTGVIRKNGAASLLDLGDGVLGLEFHSKMNAIGGDTIAMMNQAVTELEKNFLALVVGNEAENFSVGANLAMVLMAAQEGEWEEIELSVRQFQSANQRLRCASKPVVVAVQGMALGGGCEVAMHGKKIQAAAESYLGLVEVGVGLIPGGGGVKELLRRAIKGALPDEDLFPRVRRAFEMVAMAKVSTSGVEAREMGFLAEKDSICMNRDRVLGEAKQVALQMAKEESVAAHSNQEIAVLGAEGLAMLKMGIHLMKRGGFISEYDAQVASKLAFVFTGGDVSRKTMVTEEYLLGLEREAFVSLCGERRTQERMLHMLKTGKPLRN